MKIISVTQLHEAAKVIQDYSEQVTVKTLTMPTYKDMAILRERTKLSLRDVQLRTGIGKNTISRFEQGSSISYAQVCTLFNFYRKILETNG